jgi:lysophospholipase L1-like esterase
VLLRHDHVNQYLESLKPDFPNLVLVEVRELIDKVEEEGFPVNINGSEVVLRKEDLFADRVHPNELGNTLMANLMLVQLRTLFPDCFAGEANETPGPLPLPALPHSVSASFAQ